MKKEVKATKTTDILDKIKKIIVHTYRPDKILLFGSRARGDFTCESDIDILFFTHEEMQRWVTIPQSFTATILREGTTIYEKRTTRVYPKMDPKS